MKILMLWILALLFSVFAISEAYDRSDTAIDLPTIPTLLPAIRSRSLISNTTSSESHVTGHRELDILKEHQQRSSSTSPLGNPITPPQGPDDTPPYQPEEENAIAVYHTQFPENAIPPRVLVGPRQPNNSTKITGYLNSRYVLFHQYELYDTMSLASYFQQYLGKNNSTAVADLCMNGNCFPRPFRPGNSSDFDTESGVLAFDSDTVLEFPLLENGQIFGAQPGGNYSTPGATATPNNLRTNAGGTFLVFGYRSTDAQFLNPIYLGVISRASHNTTQDHWHWCPIVDYAGVPLQSMNSFNYPWTGINTQFSSGTVWQLIRDWDPTQPLFKTSENGMNPG
ncbi:hypothetical protein F5Y16DRAFT_117072 [Xylariaceae sp. FL0255]|nr:hypothetical protein F5Y16DRAFT_117072 [Xylariaceae sp. FL0255]